MKFITYLGSILIITLLSACVNDTKIIDCSETDILTVNPAIIDNVSIKIDRNASDENISFQSKIIDGEPYLFRFNDYQNSINPVSIEIYNLTEGKFIKRINFPINGPDSFYGVVNFTVHNLDSIYLHNEANPLTFYLADTAGNQIDKWIIEDRFAAAGWATSAKPFYDADNNVIWFYSISPRYFYPEDKAFFNQPYLSFYDFHRRKISTINKLGYPPVYKNQYRNGNWYPWFEKPSFNFFDDKIYISFPVSSEVIVMEKDSVKKLCFSTNELQLQEPISSEIDDLPSSQQFYMTSGRYFGVINDPYNNLKYRPVKFSQEKRNLDGKLNKHYNADFGIVVMKNDSVIGLIKLTKNIYNPHIIIPSETGLLVSTDNPFNENNSENYLNFNLIDISQFAE